MFKRRTQPHTLTDTQQENGVKTQKLFGDKSNLLSSSLPLPASRPAPRSFTAHLLVVWVGVRCGDWSYLRPCAGLPSAATGPGRNLRRRKQPSTHHQRTRACLRRGCARTAMARARRRGGRWLRIFMGWWGARWGWPSCRTSGWRPHQSSHPLHRRCQLAES